CRRDPPGTPPAWSPARARAAGTRDASCAGRRAGGGTPPRGSAIRPPRSASPRRERELEKEIVQRGHADLVAERGERAREVGQLFTRDRHVQGTQHARRLAAPARAQPTRHTL